MKWFINIKTIEELKSTYRKLSKQHHPDLGGSEETMKEINAEYELAVKRLNTENNTTHDINDGYREIINKIINLEGITIELCGSWIWVSGNTYIHKVILKESGFHWANTKKMWYWRPEEESCKFKKNSKDMDYIRNTYGSETIKGQSYKKFLA